jgi:hypothetical protein
LPLVHFGFENIPLLARKLAQFVPNALSAEKPDQISFVHLCRPQLLQPILHVTLGLLERAMTASDAWQQLGLRKFVGLSGDASWRIATAAGSERRLP